MRVFYDCEFIEDGRTIDLLSIGMVREDGATLYLENGEADWSRAELWVQENVLPHLRAPGAKVTMRPEMKRLVQNFCEAPGTKPELWAYYCAYDWVALCQLFGTMMHLPEGWPKHCRDLQQLVEFYNSGITGEWLKLPEQTTPEHHALNDAVWTKEAWEFATEPRL